MHNGSHHLQPKHQCTPIEKALSCCHRSFFRVLIRVLMEVRTGDVLWTRLRFEQGASCHSRATAERPYSCRVPSLREHNTRVANTLKRFVQKPEERFFVSIIGWRERNALLGKGMRMDIDNGIDIIPVSQLN